MLENLSTTSLVFFPVEPARILPIGGNDGGCTMRNILNGIHMKEGFDSPQGTSNWATYNSKDYLKERGVPEEAKLNIVGKEYW
ncbi:hypothetical protein [Bradyrhizobium sp. SZCCHNR3107]|uniref:hypothetical protein n=1 Tax=Bradyrhizobium sp. SZCCHNR3107 TaxID=3057459 RepID=UPI0028EA5029|nr:hypothetical protein [Bradyrhizobium sp. SZCCHNR3107]